MRAEIIAATVRFTNKRVPVYAGVSDSGTKRVISHIHAAQKSGVDALVCTMPYYAPNTSHKAVTQFFCDVLSECDVPLILYTIPQAIGSAIPLETLDEIAEHPKIVAIKDSGQDILYTRQLIERYMKPGLLNVLIGNEDNLLQACWPVLQVPYHLLRTYFRACFANFIKTLLKKRRKAKRILPSR